MKKTLEAVIVVAALALGAFVFRQWRVRREPAARPSNPGSVPGTDQEGPPAAVLGGPRPGAVTSLPMMKLSSPPRPPRRAAAVPAPAPAK